jgi:CMP-N-acetylneuraminic acid synthetase
MNERKFMTQTIKPSCYAVIPARGGSKGVPGKNIKLLNGKPLINHTIEKLLAAGCFEKVIVSSDSEEILRIGRLAGAESYLREDPEESNDVIMPDVPTISYLQSIPMSERPEFSFMVQCTSPLVKAETYLAAYKALLINQNTTVFAATNAHVFLWEEVKESYGTNKWWPINHLFHERIGRQFVKHKQVNELGAFYGFKTSSFIKANYRFFSKAFPILLSGEETIDIDTHEDWEFTEFKLRKNKNEN